MEPKGSWIILSRKLKGIMDLSDLYWIAFSIQQA